MESFICFIQASQFKYIIVIETSDILCFYSHIYCQGKATCITKTLTCSSAFLAVLMIVCCLCLVYRCGLRRQNTMNLAHQLCTGNASNSVGWDGMGWDGWWKKHVFWQSNCSLLVINVPLFLLDFMSCIVEAIN